MARGERSSQPCCRPAVHPEEALRLRGLCTNPVATWLPQTPAHGPLGCQGPATYHVHLPVPGEFALMIDSREFGKDVRREPGPDRSLRHGQNRLMRMLGQAKLHAVCALDLGHLWVGKGPNGPKGLGSSPALLITSHLLCAGLDPSLKLMC